MKTNQSTNWIPRALKHPRMTLGIAYSVPYVIEQDKIDERLSARVMNRIDITVNPAEKN